MRKINTFLVFVLILTIMLLPLVSLPDAKGKAVVDAGAGYVPPKTTTKSHNKTKSNTTPSTVRVLKVGTKEIEKMDLYEYIYGVVCGECPMLYHEEAIKAQIVAAHTYTLYCMENNSEKDYDLTTEPESSQAYITPQQAYKNWGSKAEEYNQKLRRLMDEVWQEVLVYEDKPILAAYHAISSGKTEASSNVWGQAIPYLISVDSEGDKLADKYKTTLKIAVADADKSLAAFGVTAAELVKGKQTKTDCGTVKTIACKNTSVTGEQLRAAFGLRSANFDLKLTEKHLKITVRGYGHGVGMSQNGANYLAKAGNTYRQILNHYYPGSALAVKNQ